MFNFHKLVIISISISLILGSFVVPIYASENNKDIRAIRKVLIVPKGQIERGVEMSKEFGVPEVAEGIPPALKDKVTEDMLPYVYEEIIYKDEAEQNKLPEETQKAMETFGADIAEYYPASDESIEAGDVVNVSNKSGLIMSVISTKYLIEKSSQPYDQKLMGVISGNSAMIINKGDSSESESKTTLRPLALTGRVKVKASLKNGPIETGDYLTSSAIPGIAMKATGFGKTIGMALESLTEVDPQLDYGKVMVFINVGLYAGELIEEEETSSPVIGLFSKFFSLILEQFKKLGISIQQNLVKVQRIITASLVIEKGPVPEENTIGEGVVLSGNSETTIYNNNLTPTSKIFITFRDDYQGRWWASEIGQGYFKIALSEVILQDTPFDYWIVGVGEPVLEGNLGLSPEETVPTTTAEEAPSGGPETIIEFPTVPETTTTTATTTSSTIATTAATSTAATTTTTSATTTSATTTTTTTATTTSATTTTTTTPTATTTEPVCQPSEEICDGIDNDCDGQIDEELTKQCGSSNVGACQFGTKTCSAGLWGECLGAVEPTEEICGDGIDNNCNDKIDENCQITETSTTTTATTSNN